jgi:hypothetical protein
LTFCFKSHVYVYFLFSIIFESTETETLDELEDESLLFELLEDIVAPELRVLFIWIVNGLELKVTS